MTDPKPASGTALEALISDYQKRRTDEDDRELCETLSTKAGRLIEAARLEQERLVEALETLLANWAVDRDGMDWKEPVPFGVKKAREALSALSGGGRV